MKFTNNIYININVMKRLISTFTLTFRKYNSLLFLYILTVYIIYYHF